MTHSRVVLLLTPVMLCLVGGAREASAGVTVDLLFVGKNGSPIPATDTVTAANGDALTMAVLMTNDLPLTVAAFSLRYDLGDEELDVGPVVPFFGVTFGPGPRDVFIPIGPLEPSTATFVGSFNGIVGRLAPPTLLPSGTYQMGTVTWSVTDAKTDGADILSGLFNVGVDVFADSFFNAVTDLRFNAATVNVPEPAAAALLGLGLLGLARVARRMRR